MTCRACYFNNQYRLENSSTSLKTVLLKFQKLVKDLFENLDKVL